MKFFIAHLEHTSVFLGMLAFFSEASSASEVSLKQRFFDKERDSLRFLAAEDSLPTGERFLVIGERFLAKGECYLARREHFLEGEQFSLSAILFAMWMTSALHNMFDHVGYVLVMSQYSCNIRYM